MSANTLNTITWCWIACAFLLIPVQLKITAPYGRHTSTGWGPLLPYRLGWILMELVSPATFAWFFLSGENEKTAGMWFVFALWMGHYFNRSIIYPIYARMKKRRIPLSIMIFAVFFNLMNAGLNGYFLGSVATPFPDGFFLQANFFIGVLLFFGGMAVNMQSDRILVNLRKPGETGYKIPQGGMFRWISCPNHFGEVVEWTGFAVLCWNLPALSFAIWTAANLVPRSLSHHRWYRQKFEDYPKERTAVFPMIL